jgi:hypothetical protein
MSTVLRSITSVLAGLVAVVVLSVGSDLALQAAGVFPPFSQPKLFTAPLLGLATVYRSLYGVAGGYLAARLAPDRPMGHALALGAVGLAVSITGAVAMWGVGPAWYPLALVVLAVPCAWAGGHFHQMRRTRARPC